MSNSLRPHGWQHTRLPCPSLPSGVCLNSCHISDAIQPSHPLSSPSPLVLSLSQHQGFFQWVGAGHLMVAKVLKLQLQHQSFQWILTVDFLSDWLVWSPCSLRDSSVSSSITIWKHQFFGTQPSLWYNSHIHTCPLEKPQLWPQGPLLANWCLCLLICCLGLS